MMANFGEGEPKGQIRQVHVQKIGLSAEEQAIKNLLLEIGVYDTNDLPASYTPPKGDFGRGLLIRGGQGSHWLNRLSAMTMVFGLLLVVGAVVLGGKIIQSLRAPEVLTMQCVLPASNGDPLNPPDETSRRALKGNPRPPVLGEMANVATGEVVVPPKTGQVSLDAAKETRTNILPTALGKMEVLTVRESVQQIKVAFETPPSLCASLQATGLMGSGSVNINDQKIAGAGPTGWNLSFSGTKEAVSSLLLNREISLPTKN